MKKYIIAGAILMLPFGFTSAATDYFLKIDGVDGESSTKEETKPARATTEVKVETTTVSPTTVNEVGGGATGNSGAGAGVDVKTPTPAPQEASTDYLLEIKGVDGETKKGNVEYGWKVEEGESAAIPGVEPDEIDVASDGEPLTPDFSILLGGGSENASDMGEEKRSEVANIVLAALREQGAPAEQLSLNFEKIKTKVKHEVKLFGIIPISTSAEIEVGAKGETEVNFPWWTILASGKNSENLGKAVVEALSNVLKTKHDTIKNSINNVR